MSSDFEEKRAIEGKHSLWESERNRATESEKERKSAKKSKREWKRSAETEPTK